MEWRVKQQRIFFARLKENGIDPDERGDVIYNFTGGRKDSLSALTDSELRALNANGVTSWNNKANRQRRKVLSCCYDLGWTKDGKVDMKRLDAFLMERGVHKKPLMDYNTKQLTELVTQFQLMKEKQLS